MTPAEHYREAERVLALSRDEDQIHFAVEDTRMRHALVHATLAHAGAIIEAAGHDGWPLPEDWAHALYGDVRATETVRPRDGAS